MPDCGPFGETFFEANSRAIVLGLFVKSPERGRVESVFMFATQRLSFAAIIFPSCESELGSAILRTPLNRR